jgi:hypothetical protein
MIVGLQHDLGILKMFQLWFDRSPLRRQAPWNEGSQYGLVNGSVLLFWMLRILSPAAWILSIAPPRASDVTGHPSAWRTELYVIVTNLIYLAALLILPLSYIQSPVATVIIVLLILEGCQYHIFLMVLRPVIDKSFTTFGPHNFARTIMLTLISYLGLITLFALLFLSVFADSFNLPVASPKLDRTSAWATSAGILTGSGFSGISPKPGAAASIAAGIESIIGIIFLTTIFALALGRAAAELEKRPG